MILNYCGEHYFVCVKSLVKVVKDNFYHLYVRLDVTFAMVYSK
jgi:hypothetical protein